MNGAPAVVVVGAGILGLAVAREISLRRPGVRVLVLDKEATVAAHQTGRNSGVVHAGLYYEPGSLKAQLCRRGAGLLKEFCAEHQLPYRELGKVVVATEDAEVPTLRRIEERGRRNGVPDLRWLDRQGLRELEPHVEGVAAVHSPRTAVVDFTAITRQLAGEVTAHGGEVLLGVHVQRVEQRSGQVTVRAGARTFGAQAVVVCAGLGSDGFAVGAEQAADMRIIPFRGEYHRLMGPARELVRGLVYPVPDPRYPFLGVHLTRRVDDDVLVGPNAVLALAREGYRWRDVDLGDLRDVLAWPGTRRLARQHWRTGAREVAGSLSRRLFLRQAQRYVPSLTLADLGAAPSGVRAQAVDRRGQLVDDFVFDVDRRVVVLRNAPSPAATSSLAIAEHVVSHLP